jgi:glycosyltransferase involved in cell wall biosynthesis
MGAPKVLLVTNQDWAHYTHRLPVARALRDAGFEAVFVSAPGPYAPLLEEAGFRFIPWQLNRRSLNPVREVRPLVELTRIYQMERPEAVFHFTIKPILHGALAARAAGVPAVVNLFTGLGFPFLDFGPSRYYKPMLASLLRRLLRGNRSFTVFHNEEDRQSLIAQKVVTQARSRTIFSSGVDIERFAPQTSGPQHNVPVALMAARLLWDKGIQEYVDAAQQVRARGIPARFLVAGSPDLGSTLAVDELQVTKWRDEGVVEFLGHCDDMPALLRDADVAVLPSYHEGVPRFLLESAAAGLPIIATDVPGCRVVVDAGVNGLLIPARDSAALADALVAMLSDTELRERMGKASREVAVERFSQSEAMDAHLDVLRNLGVRTERSTGGHSLPAR